MGIFDKLKNVIKGTAVNPDYERFDGIIKKTHGEYAAANTYFYNVKVNALPTYKEEVAKWTDSDKLELVFYCIDKIKTNATDRWGGVNDKKYEDNQIRFAYIIQIFRSKLVISGADFSRVIEAIYRNEVQKKFTFQDWGLTYFINQFEKQHQDKPLDSVAKAALTFFKQKLEKDPPAYLAKEIAKMIEKIDGLLFEQTAEKSIKPVLFLGKDNFGPAANVFIAQRPEQEKPFWYELITKAQKATGSKPSKKYIDEAKTVITALGTDTFKKTVHELFTIVTNLKETVIEHKQQYGNQEYIYNEIEFLSPLNTEALKGFVWMCSIFHDQQTIQTISKMADRCFKKIPQKGQVSTAVGNACLYTLANSKGLDGISQLSRLRLKIKQNSTLKIIENYIVEAANKLGVTMYEIEDLAVDDYKLKDGVRKWEIDGFTAVLEITRIGKSNLIWLKEDGKEQKTVPTVIKEKHAAQLKKIKEIQKLVDQTTSTQRDRLDRMLRSNRELELDYFKQHYLNHGLLSVVTANLIFNFINENENETVQAIKIAERWVTNTGDDVNIDQYEKVTFWHPASSTTTQVKLWRDYLMEHKILQPFKQAFREIYLLTEAEVNTRTYSNRMASHILKQHQYVTLAKGRNWTARLIGAWDGGDLDTAALVLPEYNLRAEYWVNALNADDAFNDTGIWNYVTTDQIRFVDTTTNELVELINVPAIPFSETLRDVDLFVGVASVGNDPTWQDSGGLPAYRDYWQSYSFGDLSEVAKNRKEILTGLIPRLKIANVTTIEDKFVVVKGKLRTYKIHIGSTNILMEPNDQYLCIVPDRSKKDTTENVYLPFEGDNGLSVILSKAFLLAADDTITDSTITSQINR